MRAYSAMIAQINEQLAIVIILCSRDDVQVTILIS
jgi:hypothetical protein